MDDTQFRHLLAERMQTMPKKARRCTEYLLTNMREASYLSISAIADKLQVSKAQLVRVAQLLGFEGYSDLKDVMQKAVLAQINPSSLLSKVQNSSVTLQENIYRSELANIEDTMNQLRQKDVDSFCQMLKNAGNIYCLGWGISSLVVEMLHLRLAIMGCKAELVRRSGLSLWEQVRCVCENDAVITCELPSYSVEVSEAVALAKQHGAKVITITDSPAAPVCHSADLRFSVTAVSPTFGSSIIGPLFLTHILTSAFALALGDAAKEAFDEQAKFLHDERFFHPIFGLKY